MCFLVGNLAAQRRRQHAVTVRKERRDSLVQAKRLCRVGTSGDCDYPVDNDMIIDEEPSILEAQTISAVEELKSAVAYQYVNPMNFSTDKHEKVYLFVYDLPLYLSIKYCM